MHGITCCKTVLHTKRLEEERHEALCVGQRNKKLNWLKIFPENYFRHTKTMRVVVA
jgi:hypothetical protein